MSLTFFDETYCNRSAKREALGNIHQATAPG